MKRTDKNKIRQRRLDRRARRKTAYPILQATAVFEVSAFLLLLFKGQTPDWQALIPAAVLPVLAFSSTLWYEKHLRADALILAIANFLCGLGVVTLYSLSPERGLRQCCLYALGLAGTGVCAFLFRRIRFGRVPVFLMMAAGLAFLALPVAVGREVNGAKNWVAIPGLTSFQPSEVVKLILIVCLAYFFSRGQTLRQMLPGLFFAVCTLGLLMLQKDLGTALMYYLVTLLLYWAASSDLLWTGIGLVGGCGAAVLGYNLFAHVRTRVAIWRNPWSDALGKGYQLVQALTAIASGGLFGLGLGLGAPRSIPAYSTDFIFAVICEQFGIAFGICVLILFVMLVMRGIHISLQSRSGFESLLALGISLMLGLQTFVIIGGVIKLIPLTGVTMPFVSYGGTSLVSCLCMVGVLCGISAKNADSVREDLRLAGGDVP